MFGSPDKKAAKKRSKAAFGAVQVEMQAFDDAVLQQSVGRFDTASYVSEFGPATVGAFADRWLDAIPRPTSADLDLLRKRLTSHFVDGVPPEFPGARNLGTSIRDWIMDAVADRAHGRPSE